MMKEPSTIARRDGNQSYAAPQIARNSARECWLQLRLPSPPQLSPKKLMTDDERAIHDVIARQFGSLNWWFGTSGDWNAYTADFLPGAPIYDIMH